MLSDNRLPDREREGQQDVLVHRTLQSGNDPRSGYSPAAFLTAAHRPTQML